MKNLKISTRILLGFSILLVLNVILGIAASLQLNDLHQDTEAINTNWLPSIYYVGNMNENAANFRVYEYRYLVSATNEERNEAERRLDNVSTELEKNIKCYKKLISSDEEREAFESFTKKWEKYIEVHQVLKTVSRTSTLDSAKKIMQGESRGFYDKACNELDNLSEINRKGADEAMLHSKNAYNTNIYFIVIFILVCVAIGIGSSLIIARSIISGVTKIKEAAQKIASGNLNADVDIRTKDEIGELAQAFGQVVTNINLIMQSIQTYIRLTKEGRIEDINFNEKEYSGAYREIITGVNLAAQTTVKPLLEVLGILQGLSVGDLGKKMTTNYEGGWLMLSESVNAVIDTNLMIIENSKKVAAGDLTIKLRKRSDKDELLIALSEMIVKFKEIVEQVMAAAENVAGGSQELSSSATEMSQGASEQAASAEEISSSVEEMTATILQNSENAVQTERISKEAAQNIVNVFETAEKSILAMKDIVTKISIINDIAEKTDILAINAAIEAARAGEHGKGFAVVATEVRKLAEVSQKAAKEINDLSRSSLSITENSGNLLQSIIPNIQKTAQLVQEIAAASNEQSSGAAQISKAIEQLSMVIQQNSATAEEMSSSSEELASQSEVLKDTISFFKIDKQIKPARHIIKPHQNKQAFTNPIGKGASINMHTNDSFDNDYHSIF